MSLKNFYDSDFLGYIDSLSPEQFLRIEEMDSFIFEGTKMYVIPDFAVSDVYVRLYDWKTGNPNRDDALQLACYALYAHTKWDVPFDEIQIFPVYLSTGIPGFTPWQEEINEDAIVAFLHKSIQQMHGVLSGGPQTNKIIYERCPQTENKRKCETCVFQEVCL